MCTVESTPRLPEHCVAYVKDLLWPQEAPFGGQPLEQGAPAGGRPGSLCWGSPSRFTHRDAVLRPMDPRTPRVPWPPAWDGDSPEHIQWITKKAQERGARFGIEGVDYRFTQVLPTGAGRVRSRPCGETQAPPRAGSGRAGAWRGFKLKPSPTFWTLQLDL